MDDYIKREDALTELDEIGFCDDEPIQTRNSALKIIQSIPAADVRPVVLCKDCIHYEMGACLKIYDDGSAAKEAWQERKPDDFCSYGERRANDD